MTASEKDGSRCIAHAALSQRPARAGFPERDSRAWPVREAFAIMNVIPSIPSRVLRLLQLLPLLLLLLLLQLLLMLMPLLMLRLVLRLPLQHGYPNYLHQVLLLLALFLAPHPKEALARTPIANDGIELRTCQMPRRRPPKSDNHPVLASTTFGRWRFQHAPSTHSCMSCASSPPTCADLTRVRTCSKQSSLTILPLAANLGCDYAKLKYHSVPYQPVPRQLPQRASSTLLVLTRNHVSNVGGEPDWDNFMRTGRRHPA